MPRIQTKCFGEMEYSEEAVFEFPEGMPGFEDQHAFVFLKRPDTHPLLFMQSLSIPDLCFILLPVLAAEPQYKLRLTEEDLTALCFPAGTQPQIGKDILCAVLVCAASEQRPAPTVNLRSPVVVNLQHRTGLQVIQTQSEYSYQHPLVARDSQEELASC